MSRGSSAGLEVVREVSFVKLFGGVPSEAIVGDS
jgi:hypothetical protein